MEATLNRDRRGSRRQKSIHEHGIVSARVTPGRDVSVVNVSAAGILIDTAYRLLPGSLIEMQLQTAERCTALRGRVLRCAVWRLQPSVVWYRAAIGFDRHLPWLAAHDRVGYPVLKAEMRPTLGPRADASQTNGEADVPRK